MARHSRSTVTRRTAIRTLTAGAGAIASASWVTSLCAFAETQALHAHLAVADAPQGGPPWQPQVLTAHQFETVGVLVEMIIPATTTPGAKAALVDRYIDAVLANAQPADRAAFLQGLVWLDGRSRALVGKTFVTSSVAERTGVLTRLAAVGSREASAGVNFFNAIKSMTITGYYTTEIGLRQELGDDGRMMLASFEGCTHPEHQ